MDGDGPGGVASPEMGILDVFRPALCADPALGTLRRRRGYWCGEIVLEAEESVPLLLAGGISAPHDWSLQLARDLGRRYIALRPVIERALFEHYEPYREAIAAAAVKPEADLSGLTRAEQVWGWVRLVRVLIEPLGRRPTVELAYDTAWDVEHTLGARFQEWTLVELSGSVR